MSRAVLAVAALPVLLAALRWANRRRQEAWKRRLEDVAKFDRAVAHHPATRAQQSSLTVPAGWAPPRQRAPEEGE